MLEATMQEIKRNNYHFKVIQEGGKFIPVKYMNVPDPIATKYKFNHVTVHVGYSRSELERMTKEEAQKRNYDMYMGQAGFDDGDNETTDLE